MAKTTSAKKANRSSSKRRVYNTRRKKTMKDSIKDISKLITAKTAPAAEEALPALYQAIDKAAKHGTIKPNTAARIKSRLSKQVAGLTK